MLEGRSPFLFLGVEVKTGIVLDCNYRDLKSPAITHVDEFVLKVGDVMADEAKGLCVVVGPATSGNPRHLWEAVALFPEGLA